VTNVFVPFPKEGNYVLKRAVGAIKAKLNTDRSNITKPDHLLSLWNSPY